MTRLVAWLAGLFFAALGAFVAVEGALAHSVWIVAAGVVVTLLGGYVVPNDAVVRGSQRLIIVLSPYLPAMPGGRRATDPPAPPKAGAP